LIDTYALATNYGAITHPSQPNYVALVSGSTQGIGDDRSHDINATSLADQVEAEHKSWAAYAQGLPSPCFSGDFSSGGPDGPGLYARKHEPFISFAAIRTDPARCGRIQSFATFDPAASDFELIVPNQANDMHDGSMHDADEFLKGFVPRILESDAWKQGGVLFLVWDEGAYDSSPGGHVALIAVSPHVSAGARSDVKYNHYSLLRTIEDGLGLACLGAACTATPMTDLFL
jgi:hypothetical protein